MDPELAKLEQSRRDLLDLGLRNTLLNYRDLKSRGLRVVDELPVEIFRILVSDGHVMTFLPLESEGGSEVSDEHDEELSPELATVFAAAIQNPEDESGEVAARHVDTKLQTPYSPAQLQKRLLSTLYYARTAIEEQGVNVLFLALGMLEWYEDKSSDVLRRAPLILVPVTLSRASVRARFKLRYTGDDIDTNHSLHMKLKSDHGVELPQVSPDGETIDVGDYFQQVAHAVQDLPRWRVDDRAIALGFFSFNKLLMYKDLDPAEWPENQRPEDHSVMSSLLSDGFGDSDPLMGYGENLDAMIDPAELLQVCDADSSQTVAISEALAGRNIVIQGPPGTGKSQTITNLIAEAIAAGKSLLFVSEKMAALEVVKRRLDELGLGDACLELHSNKTNKKDFLNELRRSLAQAMPGKNGRQQDVEELRQLRDRLNGYCQATHRAIGRSGTTPYRAYGELLKVLDRLDGVDTPTIESIEADSWTSSEFRQRVDVLEELEALLGRLGVPSEHPYWGCTRKVFLPNDRRSIEQCAQQALDSLEAVTIHAAELAELIQIDAPSCRAGTEVLATVARHIATAPNLAGVSVDREEWRSQRDSIERAIGTGRRLAAIKAKYEDQVVPNAWEADVVAARDVLREYETKWWRFLSGEFRRARRSIEQLFANHCTQGISGLLSAANDLIEHRDKARDLQSARESMSDLFGARWDGDNSAWDELNTIAAYLSETHAKVELGEAPAELLLYLTKEQGSGPVPEKLAEVLSTVEQHAAAIDELLGAIEIDSRLRFGDTPLHIRRYSEQGDIVRDWANNVARVQDLVTWNHLIDQLGSLDLESIAEVAAEWDLASRHLADLLRKARYEQLIETALKERSELSSFDRETHEHVLARYRELDQKLFETNRAYIAHQHRSQLPRGSSVGQAGILRREFEKRRRHKPIRQLMLDAGDVIRKIKPVFMMSPMSVATYIPRGTQRFDITVFDEASQVRPVDAFGAILRGEQSVVVGDSRQLPPTSFFDRMGDGGQDGDNGDDENTADLESILGLFNAQGAPNSMLRWHYRSRHESLIAVSNREFYDNKLVVFPSPDDTREALGLVYRHQSESAYERGNGVNRKEATAVAMAVMEHAKHSPDLTLGVAAFSIKQMQAIMDALEILRSQDESCESFFADHSNEPFFVKNLENVQGDERDVIFISVGYGRTPDGYLAMQFGPLNRDGGERRLNVLITRARRRCEVFTNLRSDDIDLNRSRRGGVVALKAFLKYAETGVLDVPDEGTGEADTPFEESVGAAIRRHGFEVRHQVGSGGFLIDLAVVDPNAPGRYILGVECDGASYHSARWARDRDRLRQAVLESLGWKIHRVWSTDWFRDPEAQTKQVLESIEAALAVAGESGPAVEVRASGHALDGHIADTAAESESENSAWRAGEASGDTVGVTCFEAEELPSGFGEPLADSGPVSPQAYTEADFVISLRGIGLHEVSPSVMGEWIREIVAVESPIHIEEVATRIASLAGVQRVGHRIMSAVRAGASAAKRKGLVARRGEFLWHPEMVDAPIRDRSLMAQASRRIERVAPEEIAAAVVAVVRDGVGASPDEATIGACRLLGYARVSDNLKATVMSVTTDLIRENMLESRNGNLFVKS